MEVKAQVLILGAKRFKGDVEGVKYDSTTVFVAMDQSERSGNTVGQEGVGMKFGASDNFERFKDQKFPVMADVLLNITSKGQELLSVTVRRPAAAA